MILFVVSDVKKERKRIKNWNDEKIIEITNQVKSTLLLHLETSLAFQINFDPRY